MITTTTALKLRTCIGDSVHGIPAATAAFYESPDLVAFGTEPAEELATLLEDANWNRLYHGKVKAGERSFFYMRAVNETSEPVETSFNLYAAEPALLFWPSQWYSNPLHTATGERTQYVNIAPGARGITPEPFCAVPEHAGEYSLVGIAGDKLSAELPLPGNNIRDYADWITGHPNLAIHNLAVVDVTRQTWTSSVTYEHGREAAVMYFELLCRNVPAGGTVSLCCTDADGVKQVVLPETTVSDGEFFIAGIRAAIPAGFSGTVSYTHTAGEHAVPPAFSITLRASMVVTDPGDMLYPHNQSPETMGFPEPEDYLEKKNAFRKWDTVFWEAHEAYATYLRDVYAHAIHEKRVVVGAHNTHAQVCSPLVRMFGR